MLHTYIEISEAWSDKYIFNTYSCKAKISASESLVFRKIIPFQFLLHHKVVIHDNAPDTFLSVSACQSMLCRYNMYVTHLGTRTVYSVPEELLLPCKTNTCTGFILEGFCLSTGFSPSTKKTTASF